MQLACHVKVNDRRLPMHAVDDPLPPVERLRITRDIVEAVRQLHGQGGILGDLSVVRHLDLCFVGSGMLSLC